jgi:hypothetical protein
MVESTERGKFVYYEDCSDFVRWGFREGLVGDEEDWKEV